MLWTDINISSMTIDEYRRSGVWKSVIPQETDLENIWDAGVDFGLSFGRRVDYVTSKRARFVWEKLAGYYEVLRERDSKWILSREYNSLRYMRKRFEFFVSYAMDWAGIDYGGATMKMQKLYMWYRGVEEWCVPVIYLHLKWKGEMYDFPLYPSSKYFVDKFPEDYGMCIPLGDVAVRLVEKEDPAGECVWDRFWTPVYVGVKESGRYTDLSAGEHISWDVDEKHMQTYAERYYNGEDGHYPISEWSYDELHELTLDALGYDMDAYREAIDPQLV